MPPAVVISDLLLSLPPPMGKRLQSLAAAESRSVESVVMAAIAEYLQRRSCGPIGELGQAFAVSHSAALARLSQ